MPDSNPRFVPDPRSGGRLVVPAELIETMQKAALAKRDETNRKFMADRGANKVDPDSFQSEIPLDDPMRGDLLSWAMAYAPWESIGGRRKPSDSVPFPFLRQVARQSVLDRIIIDTRIAQLKHFARLVDFANGKQPGFRVVHRRHEDPTFHETPDIINRCMEVQARLANVSPDIHSGFRDFVAALVEDELVVDRKVCVIYRDPMGRPGQWHAIDGTTIKPRLEVLLPWMYENRTDNAPLAAEIMSYDKGRNPRKIDLTNAAYVQEVEGRFTAAWTAEQMTIDITNPSTRINSFGYGTSMLEKSLESTRVFVMAWNYNAEIFKTNYPEGILALLGDYDPAGLEAFKRQVLGEVGPGQNWRLPIIPGGPADSFKVEFMKLRDTPKEGLFTELMRMLIAAKCAGYRMHPSEINFSADMGAQETVFARGSTETEVSNATEEGMHTILDNWCDWITRAFVQQNYDDLKLIVEGIDRPNDTVIITDLDTATKAFMTVDEARAKYGLPPLPDGMGGYINSPIFQAQQEMIQQAEMMEEQAEAYDQGDFGDKEDGEGGPAGKGDPSKGPAGKPKGPGDDDVEQDSGPGGEGETDWKEQGPTKKPPMAKTTKTKDKRKVGQRPPEGNPHDAPFSNKAAKGKPGGHHVIGKKGKKSDFNKKDETDIHSDSEERGKSEEPKGGEDRKGPPAKASKGDGPKDADRSKPGRASSDGGDGKSGKGVSVEELEALVAMLKEDPEALAKIEAELKTPKKKEKVEKSLEDVLAALESL